MASISVRTEMLLCILDGLECMFACKFRSDCFVCRVVLSFVCYCCHFPVMTQTADPTLAMKRVIKDQSCESEGKHVTLLLEHVGLNGLNELLSSPVEWISLDLICRLLDKFVLLFMFFC